MTRLLALLAVLTALFTLPASAQDIFYDVEELNAGLGETPPRADRSTPRATMESLFILARNGDWEAAAHLLDLSSIPEGLQKEKGPELAEQLKSVIDRKVVLDWSALIDRPDAMDATQSSNAATAGQPRKSLLVWELSGNIAPTSIRLNRVKPADGPPVWVFAERTVRGTTPAFLAYGPSDFESRLPSELRSEAFWGIMWWEVFGLPILIALAATFGLLVNRVLRALWRRAKSDLVTGILRASSIPMVLATVTTVFWWGMSTVFVFSGRIDALLSPLVAIGFVTALLMLIVNSIEEVLDRLIGFDDIDLTERQQAEKRERATKIAAVRRALVLVVFLVGAGVVLSTADVFRSLGFSILASAGALTLVLGFAARNVLGNIMASLQIALNQSARIGDRVVYKDHMCHVERINFTYVQLREWTGTRLVVPVEEFISETFENWTLKEPEMLRELKFKLDPGADIDALRDMFSEVLDEIDQDELGDREKANVAVTGQDVFGIDVWFMLPCADPNTSWDIACKAREKLVAKMHALEADDRRIFPEVAAADVA